MEKGIKMEKRLLESSRFFSHRRSNSCGGLSGYFGIEMFIVKKQQTDEEGRILILDVSINDSEYILITKIEQVDVLSNLFQLLKEFDTNLKKYLIRAGISIYFLSQNWI